MKTRFGILLGLVVLGLLCAMGTASADNTTGTQGMQFVNTIQPYNGPVGPDSSLYGLKIACENLDESFTFNQSERLEKEIDHSDLRLAELEEALAANRTDAADNALDQYWQKMNQTEQTIGLFNQTYNSTYDGRDNGTYNGTYDQTNNGTYDGSYNGTRPTPGYDGTGSMPAGYDHSNVQAPVDPALISAQERILSHQTTLENLQFSHPDIPELARAIDNSRALEQKLEQRTMVQLELVRDAENRQMILEEHLASQAENQQNRTIAAYEQERSGSDINRTGPAEAWSQNAGNTGHTWNGTTDKSLRETNQTWQDQQHQQDTHAVTGHDQYPSGNRDTRNGDSNAVNYDNTYRNDTGNARTRSW